MSSSTTDRRCAPSSRRLEAEGCTTIRLEDCRRLAADLHELEPPDVIITDERIIASNPQAFLAARELFPSVVVVALATPLRRGKPSPPALADCELVSPPSDEQLVRAVHWPLELHRTSTRDPRRSAEALRVVAGGLPDGHLRELSHGGGAYRARRGVRAESRGSDDRVRIAWPAGGYLLPTRSMPRKRACFRGS